MEGGVHGAALQCLMSILLVEDSQRIRALVCAILRSLAVPVVEADSGEAALALAEERCFELLITDVALPGMSGLELARCLRQRYPDLPVLCMSGHTLPSEPSGDVHFIEKPFRPDVFLSRVRGLMRRG
jgi:DNA-binding response OmpR family regulator